MNLSQENLRAIMFYNWKRGLNSEKMAAEMCETLGSNVVTSRTCRNWITKFESGNEKLQDAERSGRPSNDFLNDEIEEFIRNDKHASSREIAEVLDVHHSTICRHLRDMGKEYLVNIWVPHQLSDANKTNRINTCQQLLRMHQHDDFLCRIVTVDECWVYWDNIGRGKKNRSWRGSGDEPTFATRQSNMTTRKHMITVFWDSKGVLLMNVLPANTSFNSDYYCNLLDELKLAIQAQRRRLIDGGFHNIHFLHDNARPHKSNQSTQKLHDLGFTILPHPPYSPDISPSDYYLFSPLKSALNGRNFENAAEIQTVIQDWINGKPREFFRKAFTDLPERWKKIIDNNGNYFV